MDKKILNSFIAKNLTWFISLIISGVVFLGGWTLRAEFIHQETIAYMSVGQRFYASEAHPGVHSTDTLLKEVDSRIAEEIFELEKRLPPEDYRNLVDAQLESLKTSMLEINTKLNKLLDLALEDRK